VDRRLVPIPMSLNYLVVKAMHRPGGSCIWKTRQGLTRPHGLKFGTNIRTRAMTNGGSIMKNTDMMLIMGGNPAENHPCGFKCPSKRSARGAQK